MQDQAPINAYRSLFLSDIHLGTRGCQAELLLDFLRQSSCETLYLVGDIVDGWKMKRGWYWPQTHNDVVQKLLRMGRKGTRMIYIPGNHDDRVRDFCGVHFGGVEVVRDAIHQTADGRRFLVVHGDEFDGVIRHSGVAAVAGDLGYRALIRLNSLVARARRALRFGYWSLSGFVKSRSAKALSYVATFESLLAAEARRRGLDGVICGHIHKAGMREIEGVTYINDGDWVESCTALVEHVDGRLEILNWAALRSRALAEQARATSRAPSPPTRELATA